MWTYEHNWTENESIWCLLYHVCTRETRAQPRSISAPWAGSRQEPQLEPGLLQAGLWLGFTAEAVWPLKEKEIRKTASRKFVVSKVLRSHAFGFEHSWQSFSWDTCAKKGKQVDESSLKLDGPIYAPKFSDMKPLLRCALGYPVAVIDNHQLFTGDSSHFSLI